jgi:Type VII secretion system ESX-1, transport TM domain B
MARQATTRLYVSGYRFLLRRMEHALVRGDVRMLDDPRRAQSLSLIAGVVLAVIVVGHALCWPLFTLQARWAARRSSWCGRPALSTCGSVTPCICAQSRLCSTDRRHRRTPKPWARRRSTLPNVVAVGHPGCARSDSRAARRRRIGLGGLRRCDEYHCHRRRHKGPQDGPDLRNLDSARSLTAEFTSVVRQRDRARDHTRCARSAPWVMLPWSTTCRNSSKPVRS